MDMTRRRAACIGMAAVAACTSRRDEPDPQQTEQSLQEASPRHIIDLHCDTPMLLQGGDYDLGVRNSRGEVDIPRMREGGITAAFFSVYTSATRNTELEALREALKIIDAVGREVERFPDEVALAHSVRDIEAAREKGLIAILLGVEGGHMIAGSLAVLRTLYRLGARYLTLTHSRDTAWAGSSGSEENRGLTDFGRSAVAEMNRLGMMVDVSHVSDQTFWDVLAASTVPIIASHSSARAIAPHKRNLSDEMIRALAEAGGVVHINYYNSFLDGDYARRSQEWNAANPPGSGPAGPARTQAKLAEIGRPPLDTLLDHFDHAVQVGGIDAVGLGSDFDGVDGELPEGMQDISMVPNIAAGLVRRSYSEPDIDKILGENTLRVMADVESQAG